MKKLILAMCLISSQSLAVTLHAPTDYEDMTVLDISEIKHFVIEYDRGRLTTTQGAGVLDIPAYTRRIRAKTVLVTGEESEWSNEFIIFKRPKQPKITADDGIR